MGEVAQVKCATESGRGAAGYSLLRELLRDVSRSFYLTLRVLPGSIRDQIGLAYLLARATDTIADTGAISVEARLAALHGLRGAILAQGYSGFSLQNIQSQQSSPAERTLLARIDEALQLLFRMPPADRVLIQHVLNVISEGQALDLRRFGNATAERIVALESDAELHDYTYRVAGCVGEFWTRICLAHLKPRPGLAQEILIEKGIRFGKGLQLVNILRDLPVDLRHGRCYLPWPALQLVRLRPSDLLEPASAEKLRPLSNQWLETAEGHLEAAWEYVLALPFSWLRLRLACAWPVLIGLQTLSRLRTENVLNPDRRIKISRPDVKRIVRRSLVRYPFRSSWARLPQSVR